MYTAYFAGFVGFGVKQPCEAGGKRLPDYSKRWAYLCHAITLGVLIVIFILIAFLGVKEQKGWHCVCVSVSVSVSVCVSVCL